MVGDDSSDEAFSIRTSTPDQTRHPDLRQVNSLLLRQGPRARSEVVHYEIFNRNTGEFRGHSVGFRTKNYKEGKWQNEDSKSFTLNNEDEIKSTLRFILAACESLIPNIGGNFAVVPLAEEGLGDVSAVQKVLNNLSQEGKSNLLVAMLEQASKAPDVLSMLMEHAAQNPQLFVEATAALNLGRYQGVLDELKSLIATSARENDFQQILKNEPWLFGSEYSEVLRRRVFVRDAQFDFVVRRTSDGYIEIVEIKTPLEGHPLFLFDRDHNSYFAGRELSKVAGQVQKYIEELDLNRYNVSFNDNEDTNKIRAKIIIGRDCGEEQIKALRRFNGHLHRIEVITFDQLVNTGERVLSFLKELIPAYAVALASEEARKRYDLDDDIPF